MIYRIGAHQQNRFKRQTRFTARRCEAATASAAAVTMDFVAIVATVCISIFFLDIIEGECSLDKHGSRDFEE